MIVGKAINAILAADSAVTAIIANRIYPNLIPQKVNTYPSICYAAEDAKMNRTLGGTNALANQLITVACLARTYEAMVDLGDAVRSALEGKKGTFGGIPVRKIYYQDETETTESITDMGQDAVLHVKEIRVLVWFILP